MNAGQPDYNKLPLAYPKSWKSTEIGVTFLIEQPTRISYNVK